MSAPAPDWEKLKQSKPGLTPNIQYESRTERSERWLILKNSANGEHLRLNASAAEFLDLIDGEQTLESLFHKSAELGFSVEQVSGLIGPLCSSGMMTLGAPQEEERLLQENSRYARQLRKGRFSNPLAIKFALHNPDNWLRVLIDKTQWLFGRWLVVSVVSVIMVALAASIANGALIVKEFSRVASSPTHWWLYGLMYPALKAIHELAHALVIKRWGGSVHETGITFLVLMPIPYVDASDAWMFPSKYQRILVSAAGMLAECTLAAIGLFIFLLVQPGYIRDIGFAIFVMGSVSTLLFNANPLLKFDGYYILQDALEMPNLASRAQSYCRYLFKRYVYRISAAQSPVRGRGERVWLFSYGVLAAAYRCFITVVIALFLASQFFVLGVALALFALYQLLVNPLIKLIHYLRNSPEIADVRSRTVGLTLSIVCILMLFVALLPMPSSTRAEGVVWVPNQAQVFAGQEGVIEKLLVTPGDDVSAGQVLMRLSAPELQTAKKVAEAALASAKVAFRSMQQLDTAKANSLAQDIESLQLQLDSLQARANQLDVIAANDGQFVIDEKVAVIGRRVKQGDLLAYVVDKHDLVVKAVLTQQRVERLQAGVEQANVRLADRFDQNLDATLTRQTPAAKDTLPSPALAYNGRGGIAVASQTDDQLKTLERVFHIELTLPEKAEIAGIGGRAYVTLHHQPESLGKRWWRSTRQLLLKQLTV